MNEEEFLIEMKNFFENIDKLSIDLEEQIKETELARNDLLHELELAKLDGVGMMKVAKTLKEVLLERRRYKDELAKVMILKELTDKYNNRLITGDIIKVIGIRENKVNKKAIYYSTYEQDWCDSSAVENFSDNIMDLIKDKDIVEIELSEEFIERKDKKKLIQIGDIYTKETLQKDIDNGIITRILTVLSYNQYMANCYKVGGE